jgi:hypothetical protein
MTGPAPTSGLDFLIVAMPWETILMPSIRLGLLKSICETAGLTCEARHFTMSAMEHFHRASRGPGPVGPPYGSELSATENAGDWSQRLASLSVCTLL